MNSDSTGTEMEIFHFEGNQLRTVQIDGKTWFMAPDATDMLGYSRSSDALRMLDPDMKGLRIMRTPGGPQNVSIISEGGLWRLIQRSQRPEAKRIERWVVDVVLPTIARTGSYSINPAPAFDPATLDRRALALMVIEAEDARIAAEARVVELTPAADAWEHLATADGDYAVADAAKVLCKAPGVKIGRDRLFSFMSELGWVFRQKLDGRWRIYQTAVERGYLSEMPSSHYHPRTGELILDPPQVRVTMKGVEKLLALLTPPGTGLATV